MEEDKVARLYDQAEGLLTSLDDPTFVEFTMRLDKSSISAQIGMSPSARHIAATDLEKRLAKLPEIMTVTARGRVDCFSKPA